MRRRVGLIGIASVVALGVAVLPASPAAAEEYQRTCSSVFVLDGVTEITSDDGQAQPGGEFTLSNLRVQQDNSVGSDGSQHLVVSVGDLDGQIIELGDSFTIQEPGPELGNRVWDDVPPFTLEAPEGLGPHDITAELFRYDFPNLTNDIDCVLEGEPFAEVVVSDDPPPTTTTTTTVPDANGNGDNGDNGDNGNGDNGNGENGNGTPGVSPGEEEAVEDAVDEAVEEVAAAERALTVGAAPRFAG